MLCKQCGVELEGDMTICPLCGTSVFGEKNVAGSKPRAFVMKQEEKHLLQRILWQVTSILLLSGIVATLIIDLTIHYRITWSVYPVTVCTLVFLYASFFALWHKRLIFKILAGWVASSIFLAALNYFMATLDWTTRVALPILIAVNVVSIGATASIIYTKKKGLNILAYLFVAIAILCIGIEGIINYYYLKRLYIQWSIIVAACLLPVTAALFFMYLRTRRNADLQKIFHT